MMAHKPFERQRLFGATHPLGSDLGIVTTPNPVPWGMLIHGDPSVVRTGYERVPQPPRRRYAIL